MIVEKKLLIKVDLAIMPGTYEEKLKVIGECLQSALGEMARDSSITGKHITNVTPFVDGKAGKGGARSKKIGSITIKHDT